MREREIVAIEDGDRCIAHERSVAGRLQVPRGGEFGLVLHELLEALPDIAAKTDRVLLGTLSVEAECVAIAEIPPVQKSQPQIAPVKSTPGQQRIGKAERHARIVRPLARLEAEAVVAVFFPQCGIEPRELRGTVTNGAELERRTKRVADREAGKQGAEHTVSLPRAIVPNSGAGALVLCARAIVCVSSNGDMPDMEPERARLAALKRHRRLSGKEKSKRDLRPSSRLHKKREDSGLASGDVDVLHDHLAAPRYAQARGRAAK